MGKNLKPWLNYKIDQADVIIPEREYKTKRSYKRALMFLIFSGFAGGHKFYLYDEKRAWNIFGGYIIVVLLANLLFPKVGLATIIVILCYVLVVIFKSYPVLKADVEKVNREIKND